MPDEVRMLDNQYVLLFVRGERPVMDFKYDILKHPAVALTADGKAGIYKHGEAQRPQALLNLSPSNNFPAMYRNLNLLKPLMSFYPKRILKQYLNRKKRKHNMKKIKKPITTHGLSMLQKTKSSEIARHRGVDMVK